MTESIWKIPVQMDLIQDMNDKCAPGNIGIEFTEIGSDYLKARMPVDHRTKQPGGILHGGVSMVLAETLASVAGTFAADPRTKRCVGQEINGNHIRPASDGWVYGVTRPVHIGRRSQVWETRITDEQDRLVCISRMTLAVLDRADA